MRTQVLLSGLKIQYCHEPWCSSQRRLRSCLAMLWPAAAVVSWPLAWELLYAVGTALKRQKKKKRASERASEDLEEGEEMEAADGPPRSGLGPGPSCLGRQPPPQRLLVLPASQRTALSPSLCTVTRGRWVTWAFPSESTEAAAENALQPQWSRAAVSRLLRPLHATVPESVSLAQGHDTFSVAFALFETPEWMSWPSGRGRVRLCSMSRVRTSY